MKRQDVSGVEKLAVEGTGGSGGDVNLATIAGTAASVDTGVADAGTLRVVPGSGSTGTTTSVAANVGNVTLLATNASRRTFSLFNDSASACYVKKGATASTSSFFLKMSPFSYYEDETYSGQLDALWDTATGNMRICEVV